MFLVQTKRRGSKKLHILGSFDVRLKKNMQAMVQRYHEFGNLSLDPKKIDE